MTSKQKMSAPQSENNRMLQRLNPRDGSGLRRLVPWMVATALMLGALGTWSVSNAQERAEEPEPTGQFEDESISAPGMEARAGVIQLEGVRARVLNGGRTAFQIDAVRGDLVEDSRVISMHGPQIKIYDEKGQLRDTVSGKRGRIWPETTTVPSEDGQPQEETKYNWRLHGEVLFASGHGQVIKAPALVFDRARNVIYSNAGVNYRMPTGSGSILAGTAQQFRSRLGETSAIESWTLIGDVRMKMEKEEAS